MFYGGFAGAAIAVIVCVRRARLDIWHVADIIAPGAALGHSFGRVGCFFAGCCYGKETDVSWSVTFHDALSIAPTDIHLHPTQLYSAANEFTLFILLTLIWPYRKFKGQIFLTWMILYGVTRSTIEIFRGDPRGVYFDGLVSTSQIIAVFVVTLAIWLFMKNRKIHRLA